MHPWAALLALLAIPAAQPTLPSDPVGVYALLDQVVLKPDDQQPTTLELHGAFALAEGRHGDYYRSPRAGVVRFAVGKEPAEAAQQWRDLRALAGTGKVVGFSSRYAQADAQDRLAVAPATGPAGKPAVYDGSFGLRKVEGVDYGPVRELTLLPRCRPVAAGDLQTNARWPALKVTLTCGNCTAEDQDLAYVFTVRTSDGEAFASGPVAPGKEATSWTATLALQPGETVDWSVHVVGSKVGRAPIDRGQFVAPKEQAKGER
jgi:hypothetical protein